MDVVFNLRDDTMRVLLPSNRIATCTDGTIVHGAQSSYFIIDARRPGRAQVSTFDRAAAHCCSGCLPVS